MGSNEADEPKPEIVKGEDKLKTTDLDKGVDSYSDELNRIQAPNK